MSLIDRDALWDMQILTAVVDGGSIAAGARALQVTPSATSKRIAALERRLGVQLLQRSTRHLRVTPQGQLYLNRARDLLSAVRALEQVTSDDSSVLRGELRVTAPTVLGQDLVTPLLSHFLLQHPGVTLNLDLSERVVLSERPDFSTETFDLAVCLADTEHLPAADIIARRVGSVQIVLAASPAYLQRRGRPTKVAQLKEHSVLEHTASADRGHWRMTTSHGVRVVPVQAVFASSRIVAVKIAAVAGLGIARLPSYLIAEDLRHRRLEHVLPSCVMEWRGVYLLRPVQKHTPKRVRALMDLLARELPKALKPQPLK
jgi:DNA-binding transcriptional LysR family regulator